MIWLALFFEKDGTSVITTTVVTYNLYITWTVAALAVIWVLVNVVQWSLRKNSKMRPRRQNKGASFAGVLKAKDHLSAVWLRKGASKRIHGVGIGKLPDGTDCIQIFINDSVEPLLDGTGGNQVGNSYDGIPLVLVLMPQASFLAGTAVESPDYAKMMREKQEVILGGISAANTNLNGEVGTIGYFCRKRRRFGKSEIYLLSNSHVFADLRKSVVDANDVILQPSPGDIGMNRPIAELTQFSHPQLDNDTNEANFVDAAIAKLWKQEVHKPLLPLIGTVNGFVDKADVAVGESCRKFGRTTGYTVGQVFSVYLDIWVKYDRTGQSAFFKNQFLIEPNAKSNEKFVEKGDSGSLVVDGENFASGLIFAGANGEVVLKQSPDGKNENVSKTVRHYGVANPISEVMSRLNIELL